MTESDHHHQRSDPTNVLKCSILDTFFETICIFFPAGENKHQPNGHRKNYGSKDVDVPIEPRQGKSPKYVKTTCI